MTNVKDTGFNHYNWNTECLHGLGAKCLIKDNVTRCPTIFGAPPGLGSTFNRTVAHELGRIISDEIRACESTRRRTAPRPPRPAPPSRRRPLPPALQQYGTVVVRPRHHVCVGVALPAGVGSLGAGGRAACHVQFIDRLCVRVALRSAPLLRPARHVCAGKDTNTNGHRGYENRPIGVSAWGPNLK